MQRSTIGKVLGGVVTFTPANAFPYLWLLKSAMVRIGTLIPLLVELVDSISPSVVPKSWPFTVIVEGEPGVVRSPDPTQNI